MLLSSAVLIALCVRMLCSYLEYFISAGEPLDTVFCFFSGCTAGALLSDGQLLLDAATVSTDHVDATDTDVGVDGFVWLYGEGGYGETTHVDDAYVSRTAQRRGDADGVRM